MSLHACICGFLGEAIQVVNESPGVSEWKGKGVRIEWSEDGLAFCPLCGQECAEYEKKKSMKIKRTTIIVGNLEIDFIAKRDYISINKANMMPWMDMQPIPEDATLFRGTAEQFEDFLSRMWRKYGHLYKR